MGFFKKILSRTSPEEKAREYLKTYPFNKAINFHDVADLPVDPSVIIKQLDSMTKEGVIEGRFVGKKGWFLPGSREVFDPIFSTIEKGPVMVETWTDTFGLNRKRTILAIKYEARNRQQLDDIIVNKDESEVYHLDYLRKRWREILNSKDFVEDEIMFKDLRAELPHPDVMNDLVEEWISQESSSVVRHASGRIFLKSELDEMISDQVRELWENGESEIRFENIASEYGISREEAGKIILALVNANELEDVTVYSADELIRRRSAH